jgi:hypothetical protein
MTKHTAIQQHSTTERTNHLPSTQIPSTLFGMAGSLAREAKNHLKPFILSALISQVTAGENDTTTIKDQENISLGVALFCFIVVAGGVVGMVLKLGNAAQTSQDEKDSSLAKGHCRLDYTRARGYY